MVIILTGASHVGKTVLAQRMLEKYKYPYCSIDHLKIGLIALMDNQYQIRSNRESGDGRYDISLLPRENKYPGMIMELKWDKDLNDEELDALSAEALDQINKKGYDTEMREEGVADIIKFGIAFSGKRVKIRTE